MRISDSSSDVCSSDLAQPTIRTTIVDLPESACVGFVLLRTMGIDVVLPHEARPAAVTIRLPHQEIGTGFDFAFNMSSFKEMRSEERRVGKECVSPFSSRVSRFI